MTDPEDVLTSLYRMMAVLPAAELRRMVRTFHRSVGGGHEPVASAIQVAIAVRELWADTPMLPTWSALVERDMAPADARDMTCSIHGLGPVGP